MTWRRFTSLNAASAGLWMLLMVGSGYLFGASIEQSVKNGWTAWSIAMLAAFLLCFIAAWWLVGGLTTLRETNP